MTRSRVLASALALCLLAPAAPAQFDTAHSAFGFHLRTRWGQRVVGTFPSYSGEIRPLEADRLQVRVVLQADAVRVADSARYTAIARGPKFFDAARHPQITYTSAPFDARLLEHGGPLPGTVSLRGISREEVFELLPAECARPGRDCDVVAHGSVKRDDYGLDDLQSVLGNRVHFSLRVRLAND